MLRNRYTKLTKTSAFGGRFSLAAALGFIIATGCQDADLSAPQKAAGSSASQSNAPSWAQTVTGLTGEGAQYSIFVPTNWNGDVVYYAHGIKDVAEPIS